MNQFNAGDAVRLKLNNLQMMVCGITNESSAPGSYECVWYENAMLKKATFTEEVLEWLAPFYDVLHFGNYE